MHTVSMEAGEAFRFLGIGVTNRNEASCKLGEPNPGPLQEEKGLLTAESSPPIKLPNL